ncbi:hypothetical protein MGU_06172 [Metarhizium guizhouense ARSEF 977]|uniref:Uncharacterized protein n=1 Tax=Metarhizium guizhouense (strain ARSEF 977) TaxID=1276136 RepID=A0A0B4GI18_METGA|nr:hypothetical protein MGU_06172 [Metarhizium guizhouense ARSEF 977]
MDKFNWFFDFDRYIIYKTWCYDSSVVYRMTTWTNEPAYICGWVSDVKTNIIFLKVQSNSHYSSAYNALRKAGLELDANARNGLEDSFGQMATQKMRFWNAVKGKDIKRFCASHCDQMEISVEELGHNRIFYIIWEPDKNKQPRIRGFKEFAHSRFELQITHAEIEKKLRTPVKWVAAKLFFDGGES